MTPFPPDTKLATIPRVPDDAGTLFDFVTKLRELGVREYCAGAFRVVLDPPVAALPEKKAAPKENPDNCKCSHPLYAHTAEGLCPWCPPEKCAPEA